jgi:hypothetical protein
MNFLIKKAAVFLLLVLTFFACEKPGDIGLDIKNPGQSFGVLYTDTVTVQTSTVLIDSVRTSRNSDITYLIAGQYPDPQLGIVTARSFFQIYPATDSILRFGESPKVDSVVLILRKRFIYGDTNTVQTLNLHVLQNSIDNKVYYNNNSIAFSPNVIGRAEWKPLPRATGDTIRFKLDDSIGELLKTLNGQKEEALISSFNGFAIVPQSGSNAAVISFPASTSAARLRMYYRNDPVTTQNIFDFVVYPSYTFHQVINNKNAPWNNLAIYQPVSSAATGTETLIQGGTGIMTKVDIPHLLKLRENKTIRLNQAYLIVEPVQNKTGSITPLPQQLILYRADPTGKPLRNENGIYVPVEEFSNLSLGGTPRIAGYNTTDKQYRFDITQYLQRLLDSKENVTNTSFYLSMPSFSLDSYYSRNGDNSPAIEINPSSSLENSVSRLIIGSQQHPTNPLKLQLYYTEIK